MTDNTLLAQDSSHWKMVAKYHLKEGDKSRLVTIEHYWQTGNALMHLRNILPNQTFGKWLDDHVSSRRTAYEYISLRENFTLEEAKAIGSIRASRRALTTGEEDEPSVQRAAQTTPPPPTETEELRKVK